MGRPPIGKRAMTDAERQRRHRGQAVAKPPQAVTKPEPQPVADQQQTGTCYVCERHKLPSHLRQSMDGDIKALAGRLEIPNHEVERIYQLATRYMLELLFVYDTEEAAEWLVNELNYVDCEELAWALLEQLEKSEQEGD